MGKSNYHIWKDYLWIWENGKVHVKEKKINLATKIAFWGSFGMGFEKPFVMFGINIMDFFNMQRFK